ncbi:MAG TPA: DUF3426 domain-containing protein [Stellaceae bacterium]|nr:DUF3426 domain-containing protein [Stellaceae bacterium]
MIITCPACRTRFNVDARQLDGPAGRDVRCANCGHGWHQAPELRGEPPAPPEPAGPRVEPVIGVPAIEGPRIDPSIRPAPPPEPPRRRGGWGAAGSIALLLILAAAAFLAIAARQRVVALWPPAAHLYGAIGWPVEPAGSGLEISRIVPSRTAHGLVIEGEVTNISRLPHRVPRLKVALRDAGEKEVTSKIIAPPKPELLPGEVEHFETPFANPPEAATGVVVTFAPS